jgi:hypothetical protein
MNGVSDSKFAVHCFRAGITPTFSVFMSRRDMDKIDAELKYYNDCIGNCDSLIVSGTYIEIVMMIKAGLISKYKIEHIEYILETGAPQEYELMSKLKKYGFIVYYKTQFNNLYNLPSYVILKGPDGAGAVSDTSLSELIDFYSHKVPFIVSGGISTPEQVSYYMGLGASAIGIGTLFAFSKESGLDQKIKDKMCRESSKNLYKFDRGDNMKLNSIRFSDIVYPNLTDKFVFTDDILNRNASLSTGIQSKGKDGHIFAGVGIDNITEILSLTEIAKRLRNE